MFDDAFHGRVVKAGVHCPSGAGGVGLIPANSDAENEPSFRRWLFEMMLSPFKENPENHSDGNLSSMPA